MFSPSISAFEHAIRTTSFSEELEKSFMIERPVSGAFSNYLTSSHSTSTLICYFFKPHYKVMLNGRTSTKFRVKNGVRQGDPLYRQHYSMQYQKQRYEKMEQKSQWMVFADDVVTTTRIEENSKKESVKVKGLIINDSNTKLMKKEEIL